MIRVLVDINVVLDVMLDRQPHAEASFAVWEAIETHAAEGLLSAHAFTTIYYLMQRGVSAVTAERAIGTLLRIFGVAAMDQGVIQDGWDWRLDDFEDAVTASAAQRAGCSYIVTRDPKGFRGSPVPYLSPGAVLPLLYLRSSS